MPAKHMVQLLHIHIHPYSDHLSGSSIRKLKWGADETEWFNAPALSLFWWGPPAVLQHKRGLWTGAIWMQDLSLSSMETKPKKPYKSSIAGVLVPPPESPDPSILRDSVSGPVEWLGLDRWVNGQWIILYLRCYDEFENFILKQHAFFITP